MLEDKLTQEQRIRLESLAQANLSHGAVSGRAVAPDRVLETAEMYVEFIQRKG